MKKNIHPSYQAVTIRCACGNAIDTKSTISDVRVDICSACHPFFTGKQKIMDTAGRIDRFKKKFQNRVVSSKIKKIKKVPLGSTKTKEQKSNKEKLKSLKEKVK